jgi:hypothetical protein
MSSADESRTTRLRKEVARIEADIEEIRSVFSAMGD